MWLFRALFKQSGGGLPNYRRGPQFDQSGAANFVFEPETTLPAVGLVASGLSVKAVQVTRPFRPFQQPQVYINKSAPIAGLGGLQVGQLISQPLQDE